MQTLYFRIPYRYISLNCGYLYRNCGIYTHWTKVKHKMSALTFPYDLIEETSTKKLYIEYETFKSNHISHGIVALYKMGADRKRVEDYIGNRSSHLEPAAKMGKTDPALDSITYLDINALRSLLGKRESFYKLLRHSEHRFLNEYKGSIPDFVKGEFMPMMDGMHVAALHPLIQMGYGLSIGSEVMINEATAYLHFSYFPHIDVKVPDSEDKLDLFQVVDKLWNDHTFYEEISSKAAEPSWMPWYQYPFQRTLGKILTDEKLYRKLLQYKSMIKLPEWFSPADANKDMCLRLMEWALECAITVFCTAENRNEFFLLHGVTSGWALLEVLKVLDRTEDILKAVDFYVAILLGVYLTQGKPQLHEEYLQEASKITSSMEDLQNEVIALTVDEHVYKLVHVCTHLSKTQAFADKHDILKLACRICMDHKLY